MAINKATNKVLFGDVKSKHSELEEKIFKSICLNRYFEKDLAFPFAVLERDAKKIVLGANPHVASRMYGNHVLHVALSEIVSKALGGESVEVEVKKDNAAFLEAKKRVDKMIEKAEKEELILAEVEEQKSEGRCNLIPFPVKENKVRSDLTIERHAIFAANTFKGNYRTHERKIRDPQTGEAFNLSVEIGDPDGRVRVGVLKQRHQEAFYKLSQEWARQKYKIEVVGEAKFSGVLKLSVYDLVQLLRGEDTGKAYKKVFDLLREMAIIRVNIKKKNIETGKSNTDNFSLVLGYEWKTRDFNDETLKPDPSGESQVRIRFSDFVTDNFLRKNIKTLMLDPYFKLKDQGRKGVSQLLYSMLDYELSNKEGFNISLVNLAKRLGLTEYGFKSKRKEKIKGSISAVNNAPILDGKYKINCHMTESEDGKDWILVARRVKPG